MWKQVLLYGALLAAGSFVLEWLDYQRLVHTYSTELYIGLVALAFLALGIYIGLRVFAKPVGQAAFEGNPRALASLGISGRELEVLRELAAGHSNKEIAAKLAVSPNTVKTHTARLFGKLGARRRTDAINRARELGILR
ncbi:MAG TPA: LuxR C-terminal-related transcriptional regulator [Gammaproteobacteria bacterium]|nr:LuxR C-terminal-related transcriptional regulator [Gammaproteobacteria bacterium]